MRNTFRFLIVLLAMTTANILAGDDGQKTKADEKHKEIVLYDADRDGVGQFNNMTCPWVEGSDYIPETKTIESDGGKWLEFSYKGSKGMARSLLDCEKTVKEQLKSGGIISGFKVIIDYSKDDFGKIKLQGHTATGIYVLDLALKKGTHEYIFKGGFNYQEPKWDLLSTFAVFNEAKPESAGNFRLKKVILLVAEDGKGSKELEITFIRPVQEIYFASAPLDGEGKFTPDYKWGKLAEISGFSYVGDEPGKADKSPVKANIGYDNENLFLRVEAEYPTRPQAVVKENDLEVWQDEALELFFDCIHTDVRRIQFVVNADGVTFDYLIAFDVVAASVINNLRWNMPHKKNISYANGKIAYDLAFPLQELHGGHTNTFIGFQMVQDYIGRGSNNLFTLRWANTPQRTGNTDPYAFGFLVFNREPFGAGAIKAEKIDRITLPAKNECDLYIKVALSGFVDGTYTATQWIMSPDHTVFEKSDELTLKGDRELTCFLPEIKNLNGTYTWVLGIKNKSGNTKLFSMNFKNEVELIDLFGEDILWPRPKKTLWAADGAFKAGENNTISVQKNASERTLLTAKMFQEKLLGYAGREYQIVKGGNKDIVLRLAGKVKFSGKTEKLKPEGYHLKVTPEMVEITGADEPGLYYGTLTFIQLLKMPMRRLDSAPTKCVEILDWPDLHTRVAHTSFLPDQISNKVEVKTSLDYLLAWIDRFVAGNKFNMFTIHVDSMTIFKRRPEVNWNLPARDFTLEDWKKVSDYCRDRFIKIIPTLPAGGHDYWLTFARPEFREKGWSVMANVAHPDYFPTYRDCALDIIEATGCEYFKPQLDEWWHDHQAGETPDELIYGKTRPQAMLDFILQLHQFCKEHKVKLVINEDMLNPMHNGRRYEVYKIIDQLPRDIIINPWAFVGGVPACTEYFYNKGFTEMWAGSTSFKPIPEKIKRMYSGVGTAIYAWWGGGASPDPHKEHMFQWMAHWFRGSDYAWNYYQGNECSVDDEINSGVFPALSAMYAENTNPYASQDIVPVDIASSLDTALAKFIKDRWPDEYKNDDPVALPKGETVIGNIPTVFSMELKNCVIVDQKQKVEFPVSGKFSSLVFLQSAINMRDSKKELAGFQIGWRTWHMGLPLGSYLIEYADGTTTNFTVYLGLDTYYLKTRPLGGSTVYNRYIFHTKDTNGANMFLYQSEWVNPSPEKEIKKVSFIDEARIPLKTAIFAISGRKVKHPAAAPPPK